MDYCIEPTVLHIITVALHGGVQRNGVGILMDTHIDIMGHVITWVNGTLRIRL